MARPMGHIRILLGARVLFNLEEADAIFREKGEKEYADYMRGRGKYAKDFVPELGGRYLPKGPMWEFAKTALSLNKPGEEPVVEVGLLCKDTGETAIPIFRNLDVNGLNDIGFRIAIAGNRLEMSDHESFGTDLLLTRNEEDVQLAVDNGIAAAVIQIPPAGTVYNPKPDKALRIYVDGDAVAVGQTSEVVFQGEGLDAYRRHESETFDVKIEPGPFTAFLAKASALNARFPAGEQPFKLSLLTARGNEAAAHMPAACEKLGIVFNDRLFFLSGADKSKVLEKELPAFFADDQRAHLDKSKSYVPAGQVAYPTGSAMWKKRKAQEKAELETKVPPVQQAAAQKFPPRPATPRPKGRH
jgi:5'-nucleotidase